MSGNLTQCHGEGFSRRNLIRIRPFYLTEAKGATASHLLIWSHRDELRKLDDPLERVFRNLQA